MKMLSHALGAVALCVLSLAAAAAPLPITYFTKHSELNVARISPTGEYIAASIRFPGETDREGIIVMSRKDKKIVGKLSLMDDQAVADFRWVNDERLVVTPAQKFGALASPRVTGELIAVNADGSKPLAIFGPSVGAATREMQTGSKLKKATTIRAWGQVLDTLLDDDDNILVYGAPLGEMSYDGARTRVYKVGVYNAKIQEVERSPVRNGDFLTDDAGAVRVVQGVDAHSRSHLYYRAKDADQWQSLSETSIDDAPDLLGISGDGNTLYLSGGPKGSPEGIYTLNPATGQQETVAGDPVSTATAVFRRPNSKQPIAFEFMPGRSVVNYLDPKEPLSHLHRSLVKAFGDQMVEFTSFTKDGKEAVAFVHSDRNPGDFYIINLQTKKADYLMSRADWLDPQELAEMKPFSLKARDGLELHGYLTLPNGVEAKNLPLIVFPHGGPHGPRDMWDYDTQVQLLANHGYAVLQLNFRGSGGYGTEFMTAGYRKWGREMQDDLTDATLWAVQQGYADKKRICIAGASYGGYAALMGAVREPDLYRCVVSYVGVTDLPLMFSEGDSQRGMIGVTTLEKYLGSDQAELKARSPVYNVDKIKAPVFLAVGGRDERVVPTHGERMRDALTKAGKPVEWLYMSDEAHGFYKEEHNTELYTKMLAFFEKHIGPGVTATRVASQ